MQHTMSAIKYLDSHLLNYRREIAVPCNVMAKSIKCSLLMKSTNYHQWYYYGGDDGKYRLALQDFSISHADYLQHVSNTIDKKHLGAYTKLATNTQKTVSLFPSSGCDAMQTLFDERLRLHYLIVLLRYMRITADLSYHTAILTETIRDNPAGHSYV